MANTVGCSPAAVAAQYATDGLLVADWEKILYVNPALARLLGVGEADLIGQPIERFGEFVTEPDTVDRLRNAFRQGQPFLGMVTCHPRTGGSIPLELEDEDRFGRSVATIGSGRHGTLLHLAVGTIFDDAGGSDRGAVWNLFVDTRSGM